MALEQSQKPGTEFLWPSNKRKTDVTASNSKFNVSENYWNATFKYVFICSRLFTTSLIVYCHHQMPRFLLYILQHLWRGAVTTLLKVDSSTGHSPEEMETG